MINKKLVASCGENLKLYSYPNYELTCTYNTNAESGQLRNISWCNDGSWMALVPYNGYAEIVGFKHDCDGNGDQNDNQVHCCLLQKVSVVKQVTAAAFQHTIKHHVALCSVNGNVLLYDVKQSKIKKQFAYCGSAVTYLDWNTTDTHLAAGSIDGNITLYNNSPTASQKCSVFAVPESKSVSAVQFHPILKDYLACASNEGVTSVCDVYTGKHIMYMKTHMAPISDVAFSSLNHSLLISVALDRTYQCYDINTKELALSVLTDHPLSAVDMAPDGLYITVGTTKGSILVFDLRRHDKSLTEVQAQTSEIKKIMFKPNAENDIYHSRNEISENCFSQCPATSEQLISQRAEEHVEKFQASEDFMSDAVDSNLPCYLLNTNKQGKLHFDKKVSSENPNKNKTSLTNTSSFDATAIVHKQTPSGSISCDLIREKTSPEASPRSPRVFHIDSESESIKDIEDRKIQLIIDYIEDKICEISEMMHQCFLNVHLTMTKQMISHEKHLETLLHRYYYNNNNNNGVHVDYAKEIDDLRKENEYLKKTLNDLLNN